MTATSIEELLVKLIDSASAEVNGEKKVESLYQIKKLASNHVLLNIFFDDILAPSLVISFDTEATRLVQAVDKTIELWSSNTTGHWNLSWSVHVANTVGYLRFSPDATLFCSSGKPDNLVKIWYGTVVSSYSFIYLNHPAPITNLEWRRTGKFTPRGSIANILMTTCEDNRVRIWVQTHLPDVVNSKLMPHFHLALIIEDNSIQHLTTHWINNKEMSITRSLESILQDMLARILKDSNEQTSSSTTPTTNELDLEHDVTNTGDDTLTAESSKKLRHKLCRKINKQRAMAASGRTLSASERISAPNGRSSPSSLAEEFDKALETLLKEWRTNTDLLFSINMDGTLASWQLKYLDGEETGAPRQVQVEKFSRLGSALPMHDAATMLNITAYSASADQSNTFIVTQHVSGFLGLWKLNLEQGVELVTKITGLPITPEWLQDGILQVEFDESCKSILTNWVSSIKSTHEHDTSEKAFTGAKDLYRASNLANSIKILPQYHLKQLVELLAFGKLQRVKAILNHLVTCLAPSDNLCKDKRKPYRSRTFSVADQSSLSFQDSIENDVPTLTIQQPEEVELDYVEVTSIKPLTLYSLINADFEDPTIADGKIHQAHEEFSATLDTYIYSKSQVDETLDEILGKSTIETINKQKELKRLASEEQGKIYLTGFNRKKAKLLTRILTHTLIPGLSNLDQMHLLAVADAVASFDASSDDLNEYHDDDTNDGMDMVTTNIAIDSLDDRGLKFLTAMRQYVYLTKCLPMKQRTELKAAGIGTDNIVWAFHSESQDELVGLIPCVQRNKPEWSELREYGVGWWLKKLEVLKKLIEKVAQSAYQTKQDPLDAALFYLAMKKKTLVCALLRRTNCDKRLLKLFEQDFNDPVNRKKALKNAYALLGLHRFEHAAAFFLLAGSIWDTVEVCINNLNDIQLAMVLIRLHDSDASIPSNLKRLLFTEVLGSRSPADQVIVNTQQTAQTTRPPPLPSTFDSSLITNSMIDKNNDETIRKMSTTQTNEIKYQYDFEKAHKDPFLRSMALWKLGDYLSAVHTLLEGDVNDQSGINAGIFNFYRFLKDQPLVNKHKMQLIEELELKKRSSPLEEDHLHVHRARSLSSGELSFDGIRKSLSLRQSSTEFEVLNETTRLVDKYSDEAVAENERRLFFSTAHTYLDSGCPLLALEVLCSQDHLNMGQAQRMKFIACLHILLDELNTLAQDRVGGEEGGGGEEDEEDVGKDGKNNDDGNVNDDNNLRLSKKDDSAIFFHDWFDKNMNALRSVCSFSGSCEAILRTMLTYSSLHMAKEEKLYTVRRAIQSELLRLSECDEKQQQ